MLLYHHLHSITVAASLLLANNCNAFSPMSTSKSTSSGASSLLLHHRTSSSSLSMSQTVEDPVRTNTVQPPPISPATNLPNQIYNWRSHQVRYQVAHPTDTNTPSKGSVILIHGLFVNSDHWRYTLKGLADAGYTAYAIDLLGSGYSSKPNPKDDQSRKLVCGESNGRFTTDNEKTKYDVTLGTASGQLRNGVDVDLVHPCESPYNFFTWAEQVVDFAKDVILPSSSDDKVTVVANSIGTITAFQSVLDNQSLFNGAFIVNPNFCELHSAEVPLSNIAMSVIRQVQSLLRNKGQGLFDALAKPDTVKQILMEPYAISDAVDDELVDVLLTPLLTPGAADVVFDTLSYSAGPLPEQQLREKSFPNVNQVPVWVCYGSKDPWTPPERVERLVDIDSVERVIRLDGVGHCPHDEAPDMVNPLLLEFMERI
jgi:pimeloyl-ACP methyl ester carboxylesterase